MAKNLVIVESPAKVKTLTKFLGRDFSVKASVGHIKDLPKSGLGVDLEGDFTPEYVTIPAKSKVIKELKAAAKGVERIYLAPDPDREGEAIAWHVAEELKGKGKKAPEILRVQFNEITKSAVLDAIAHPSALNRKRYESQMARRVLDRIVGYKLSPLLWEKVRRGLSAGRVQSVAVRLICEREEAIRAFVPQEYWTIAAKLEGPTPPPFEGRVTRVGEKKAEIGDGAEAGRITEALKGAAFRVLKVERKEKRRNPAPPFITSTLQQEAARKLGYTAKRTMTLAQRLYEGVELGSEGSVALITYMRTDSVRSAQEAVDAVRKWIGEKYGAASVPEKPNVFKSRKTAQEAHEAVRPTGLDRPPDALRGMMEPPLLALYELIWNRFVASQMTPAVYDATAVDIEARAGTDRFLLRANGSILKEAGFLAVYAEGQDDAPRPAGGDDKEEDAAEATLPPLKEGDALSLLAVTPAQHFTEPPPRYSEASLVREMEEKGIGRPSTYASILSTIQEREYVQKDKGRFAPTELGRLVNNLLVGHFPQTFDVGFTAQLEEELDEIEEGAVVWTDALRKFYDGFRPTLEVARKEMRDVKKEATPTDVVCEQCGAPMVIRWGRNGEFLACSKYPECRNTREFRRDAAGKIEVLAEELGGTVCEKCGKPMKLKRSRYGEFLACTGYPECRNTKSVRRNESGQAEMEPDAPEATGKVCEKCGGAMVVRRSRGGVRFLACSNYPKCKNTKSIPIGIPCPECGGDIVERQGKRRNFFGCSNYPKCNFAVWDRPVAQPCPQCAGPLLVEHYTKTRGRELRCPKKECGWVEAQDDAGVPPAEAAS